MTIAIIGAGYVGLVTGACFAELGNTVICADNDTRKISQLKKGVLPIYEPGLEELLKANYRKNRITFTKSIAQAVKNAEIVFIAVGTPPLQNGEADLTGIEAVARTIASHINEYTLIVEKSTVPVKTGEWVTHTIATHVRKKVKFDVASNPEFLREGSAINDFMHPDRIVIGVESKRAEEKLLALYKPLKAPMVVTDIKSAELIKHASNSFLAMKISFINSVSQICEKAGADIVEVALGMGLDKRIGASFLNAGVGYGGSCFPKDLDAFITIAQHLGADTSLLTAVKTINAQQQACIIKKVKDSLWIIKDKTVAVLGLAFKPNTDDIRNAPALTIIDALQKEGAHIRAYDPQAMPKAKTILKDITFAKDPYAACRGANCMIIITDWDEFKEIDFRKLKKALKRPIIIDGRNIYEPAMMKNNGFIYTGIGRRKI